MKDHVEYVEQLARGFREARAIDAPGPAEDLPPLPSGAATVLLFSPHPDDECIVGGLPLRLRREAGMRIVNVPMTLGTDAGRRQERRRELTAAVDFLGFELRYESQITTAEDDEVVDALARLLVEQSPVAVFFPHERDGHPAHVRTHRLVMAALGRSGARTTCAVVETEYWLPMSEPPPNLLVESSPRDVARLVAATSLHRGEVSRNPYHLRLPAWMMDNVRRSEVLLGKGSRVPDFVFATLYRLRGWRNGRIVEPAAGARRVVGASEDVRSLVC